MYPFVLASTHKTDKRFAEALPECFLYFFGKSWVFNTNARKEGLQMINKVISIVSQKSTREIIFP
jgi:hypothetical protein